MSAREDAKVRASVPTNRNFSVFSVFPFFLPYLRIYANYNVPAKTLKKLKFSLVARVGAREDAKRVNLPVGVAKRAERRYSKGK